MGKTTPILFILLHVSVLLNSVIAGRGFTMRMIHKDSEESPFSPVDDHLTQAERFERLVEQSRGRARYIGSQILVHSNATSSMNPDIVRAPVVYEGAWYVGLVGIGTFLDIPQPFLNYYLMIDSGSYLTWLQCKGATKTFNQDWAEWPLYPWEDSTTYQPIPCQNHSTVPPCDHCNEKGECSYTVTYESDAVTSGVIAKETFTINSNTGGGLESLQLLMGCGFRQENFITFGNNYKKGKPDLIAGILGLGRGVPLAFQYQLGAVGQGKFAYCLEKNTKDIHAGNTYLSFGADATIGGEGQEVRRTPIIVPQILSFYYYIVLEDISVGQNNVGFVREDFEIKDNGRGGCIIDSGTPYTMMYKDHFDRVAPFVMAYFEQIGMRRDESTGTTLCYVKPPEVKVVKVPIITFHFQQADYVVSETGFVEFGGNVCLAIGRLDSDAQPAFILGALQQTNKRILYDNIGLTLSFADENCLTGF